MSASRSTWVVVLAAGDGRRLSELTTVAGGLAVPKQYCSLRGGPSLLREALLRAGSVADPQRICTVVAEQHRRWWEPGLAGMPAENVIVQPRNCGTANGMLLPLLHIFARDPAARLVFLPSDHHVDDERVLAAALRDVVRQIDAGSREILLLGMTPDQPDPELGYIVPATAVGGGPSAVLRFAEKPSATLAQRLIEAGALWNSFIMAARAGALLALFESRMPQGVAAMRDAVERDHRQPGDAPAITRLYQGLADVDFSRQVLEGVEPLLRVVPVPPCGWSDLGTPGRLAETLGRLASRHRAPSGAEIASTGILNLSLQHARRRRAPRIASG